MSYRIGQGIDIHRLEDGLDLWLGGIRVPSDKGCVAHSDGDVLLHLELSVHFSYQPEE